MVQSPEATLKWVGVSHPMVGANTVGDAVGGAVVLKQMYAPSSLTMESE